MCSKEQGFYQPIINELDDNNPPNNVSVHTEYKVYVLEDNHIKKNVILKENEGVLYD